MPEPCRRAVSRGGGRTWVWLSISLMKVSTDSNAERSVVGTLWSTVASVLPGARTCHATSSLRSWCAGRPGGRTPKRFYLLSMNSLCGIGPCGVPWSRTQPPKLSLTGRRTFKVSGQGGERKAAGYYRAARVPEALEGLRGGDFVHQVAVDVDEVGSVWLLVNEVVAPHLVEKRGGTGRCGRFAQPARSGPRRNHRLGKWGATASTLECTCGRVVSGKWGGKGGGHLNGKWSLQQNGGFGP